MLADNKTLTKEEIEEGSVLAPKFGKDGLLTAVVQDYDSGEILMLAHMNAEALEKTITSGKASFWSRSRSKLWVKGETSGNYLLVKEILIDCDQDAVVIKAKLDGTGVCHTGAMHCFYRKVETENGETVLVRKDT